MSTEQYGQRVYILVAAVVLAGAVSIQAAGVYFQNSYGLVSPSNVVTFSEYSPYPNTTITTEYEPYGVTFVPYVKYASIYDQTTGTPNIDPTACVANFVQFGAVVPTFSIVFDRPVSAAAFAVLTQPGTFQITALWAGIEVPGGPHTFTGGFGPDRTTNFVGFSGVTFDELRVSHISTSDGALVLDNLQFTPALVNNWTNPFSARWDSVTNWSLRSLPGSNQTVYINNGGYKAVDIDSATVSNFTNSLTVSNLLVSAPTNALSTLLLNYAGLNAALKVLNNCVIGTNGTIANYYSSLEVDGNGLLVDAPDIEMPTGGSFTQVGGLTVVNGPFFLRSGKCNSTNGNLTLSDFTIGDSASNFFGYFTQDGGSIAAQQVTVQSGGYTLVSGTLYGIGGTHVSTGGGHFNQAGGTNYGDIAVSDGVYSLASGMVKGNLLSTFGRAGNFQQSGGLLDVHAIYWAAPDGNFARGEARCGSFSVTNGYVVINGGDVFVTNNVDLSGVYTSFGEFRLLGGRLRASTITMHDHTVLDQYYDSTNELSDGLTMVGNEFITLLMWGGTLETPYISVGAHARVSHNDGQNLVHGVLSITGDYEFAGGKLVSDEIYLRGSLSLQRPGIDTNLMGSFTNTGLIDLGGNFSTELPDAWVGQVRLSTNANITFTGPSALLHFASSAAVSWTPGALLVISNWTNAGNVHIFFGSNASALSGSQLAQITFSNPGGFPSGNYPAQLLSTGELVPAPRPTLQSARSGFALALTWNGNYQLLSATNVNGPYTPVPGASSPWTNVFSKAQEFFRLQGL